MIRIVLEIIPEITYAKAEALLEENGFFIPTALEAYREKTAKIFTTKGRFVRTALANIKRAWRSPTKVRFLTDKR